MWPKDVQETRDKDRAFEVKMGGRPWMPITAEAAVSARVVMIRMLDAFDELGYELVCSAKMGGYDGDVAKSERGAWRLLTAVDSWFFAEKR